MIEDALREAFAARAGSTPPTSLNGIADVAIRNAGRIRRRRRTAMTGFAAFIVMAVAAISTFHVLTPAATDAVATENFGSKTAQPPATTGTQTAPPAATREINAMDWQAQPSQTTRLQLPDNGTVAAAYKAKDGYLVVNSTESDGKQLVLQDEHDKQQVLVKKASNIVVAKGGDKVAWAQEGTLTVAARSGGTSTTTPSTKTATTAAPGRQTLIPQATIKVPSAAVPVTFVGSDLVLGREEGGGFDVWYAGRGYTESWDDSVLRIFGAPDTKSVYAEIKPADPDTSMCLALLALDQPFKVLQQRCGLPMAAKSGGRVSPDGHWLGYPVEGLKQIAMLDLTKIFEGAAAKTWTMTVTTKTVWINATTFVVDSGGKFFAITPTAAAGTSEPLHVDSKDVVLIEPLYSE